MKGTHLIADLYDCRPTAALLECAAELESLCCTVIAQAGLTLLSTRFHQFAPGGATGVAILAESHLAVHTWPETGHVTLDVFVCNFSRDNSAAAHAVYRALEAAFLPGHTNVTVLERGRYE